MTREQPRKSESPARGLRCSACTRPLPLLGEPHRACSVRSGVCEWLIPFFPDDEKIDVRRNVDGTVSLTMKTPGSPEVRTNFSTRIARWVASELMTCADG